MSLKGSVEAALFAFGGPATPDEIGRLVGSPAGEVEEALEVLRVEYRDREGGIGITRGRGRAYVMEIKPRYVDLVSRLVQVELDTASLKTLALVALLQPVPQSEIVKRRGDRAYGHVRALVKRGYLKKKREGRSYALSTTSLFGKTFRFRDDPEEIRRSLLADDGASGPDWLREEEDAAAAPEGSGSGSSSEPPIEVSGAGPDPAERPEDPGSAGVPAAGDEAGTGPGAPEADRAVPGPGALPEESPAPAKRHRARPDPRMMKLETGGTGLELEGEEDPIPFPRTGTGGE